MKKLILTPFFILVSILAFSQEWFPVGAQWTYGYFSVLGPYYTEFPRTYEVEKDTIILGQQCKKIKNFDDPSFESYRYQDSGLVYYYEPQIDTTWNLLYDFTKQVGDTIVYPQYYLLDSAGNQVTYFNLIDTVYDVIINNDTLRAYGCLYPNLTVPGYGWMPNIIGYPYFAIDAIERVSGGELPWYGGDYFYDGPLGLRCYQDNQLGSFKAAGFQLDCDTTFTYNTLNLKSSFNDIRIHPNPSSGELFLEFNDELIQNAQIRIYNLQGREIIQKPITNQKEAIRLDHLQSGVYIYEIENDSKILRDKLIIQ